ncbi:GspH/FimT family pseudopilin [Thiolapillus sp.]
MDVLPSRARGFTLVELLVAVAVMAILTSLAIPAFSHMKARNAMAGSVNLFLAQLYLARSTAIARETHITLCPSADGSSCDDDHQNWQSGYLIFENPNKNRQLDPGEAIISHEARTADGIRIQSSSRHRNRITFRPQGRAWFSNTSIRFCDDRFPELNRKIVVSNNGRIRLVRTSSGSPVTCRY